MVRQIYFDNAATTQVIPEVLEEILPYFSERYGNPSSLHELGAEAAAGMRIARERVAKTLNCYPSEITFTSGGTESDNIALMGVVGKRGRDRIVTSAIEHSAIIETCSHARSIGYKATIVPVDREGFIDMSALDSAMGDDVAVLSVMAANNVIGTLQDLRELSKIAHEHGALFHTDAVQAYTKVDIDIKRDGIDMLSLSGHKVHAPKGTGALFVRDGTEISPIMFGGGQERGLRSSTENVPAIVGLGKAAEYLMSNFAEDVARMTRLRDRIIDTVLEIDGSALNGPRMKRLCNNTHFRFEGVRGQDLVLKLSRMGIAASTASACSASDNEPSHVLSAIGLNATQALSSLRVTLSGLNTDEDVDRLAEILPVAIKECRQQ
ncbi:MAG: aminotransferase class V-fold PLP-dependent enzyme [Candidatus Methanomethylophilaceae archaeon]|nr:aminotransferase class V-fold PLP-dependent enzyme [Candidatus Methanomethylophilaceae archaeon]